MSNAEERPARWPGHFAWYPSDGSAPLTGTAARNKIVEIIVWALLTLGFNKVSAFVKECAKLCWSDARDGPIDARVLTSYVLLRQAMAYLKEKGEDKRIFPYDYDDDDIERLVDMMRKIADTKALTKMKREAYKDVIETIEAAHEGFKRDKPRSEQSTSFLRRNSLWALYENAKAQQAADAIKPLQMDKQDKNKIEEKLASTQFDHTTAGKRVARNKIEVRILSTQLSHPR